MSETTLEPTPKTQPTDSKTSHLQLLKAEVTVDQMVESADALDRYHTCLDSMRDVRPETLKKRFGVNNG